MKKVSSKLLRKGCEEMSKNYVKDTFEVLMRSETLKRLLWYPPEDILTNTPDPLSLTLPNISDSENFNWKVIEDRILINSKSDDLADVPKCRLYLYLGDVHPTGHRYYIKQDIVIDVLWNELFDNDLRFDSISQTLKSLLVGKQITGIGKMEYYDGMQIGSPKNYSGYRHIFQVGSTKL
jgi:hypothetical protein